MKHSSEIFQKVTVNAKQINNLLVIGTALILNCRSDFILFVMPSCENNPGSILTLSRKLQAKNINFLLHNLLYLHIGTKRRKVLKLYPYIKFLLI